MPPNLNESIGILIETLARADNDIAENKHILAREKITWCIGYLQGLAWDPKDEELPRLIINGEKVNIIPSTTSFVEGECNECKNSVE